LTVGAEIDLSFEPGAAFENPTAIDANPNDADLGATEFGARQLRDPENAFDPAIDQHLVASGAVIEIFINLTNVLESAETGLEYDTQDEIIVRLVPKHGQITYETLTAPSAFKDRYVDVY
jgi:archaellin